MTRREELAVHFLAGMLANPACTARFSDDELIDEAFKSVDAFLAACEPEKKQPCLPGFTHDRIVSTGRCIHCEPEQKPEREPQGPCCATPPPDAVWTVETHPHGFQVRYADGTGMLVMQNDMACTYDQFSSLLAGRNRVELEIRVREVKA